MYIYNFFLIDIYNTFIAIPTICNQFIIIKIIHENAQTKQAYFINNLNL